MSVQTYLTSLRTSMRKGKLDETVRQIGEIIMKLLYKSFEVM